MVFPSLSPAARLDFDEAVCLFGQRLESALEEMDEVPDTTPQRSQRMKLVPRHRLADLLRDPEPAADPHAPVTAPPGLADLDLGRFDPDWTGGSHGR